MISTEASDRRDLLRELDHMRHRLVAIEVAVIVGDGGEHRRDQLGIGRQRDVFLGAGMDRGDRGAGVGSRCRRRRSERGCARLEPRDQVADVDRDVDHQQVGAAAGAQHGQRLSMRLGVGDVGALVHRDLGRGGELALERADDQKSHGSFLLTRRLSSSSALMISVMVTPSLSSTSTTSPRATRRLLT